jgi:hypothetical protein
VLAQAGLVFMLVVLLVLMQHHLVAVAAEVDTLLLGLMEQQLVQTVALVALAEQAAEAVAVVEQEWMQTQEALAEQAEQVVVLFTTKENKE